MNAPLTSDYWSEVTHSPTLIAILVLAAIGTTTVFGIGAVAYSRRRTLPYLLLTLALGALVARTILGLGTVFGIVPMFIHHVGEHGLDFLVAVLVLAAVYISGEKDDWSTE